MKQKAFAYWQLMRMDKPIGTLLLLWPTYWALFLAADGLPDLTVLAVFTVGVILMRSAGCVINDFADRHLDGHVKRTQNRPLPSGRVTGKEAIILFLVLALASFVLVLTMNKLTIMLSFVGAFLAALYPFMKRYTNLPQLFLGLAFSWSIPMAWAAQTGSLSGEVWLLFAINLMWTVAYDTQYAMVDRDDDLKIGIKSTAILFGRWDKLIIGLLQFRSLLLLVLVGNQIESPSVYNWMIFIAATLFVYQQYLIRNREREFCFKAFLNNNYVGMAVTVGLASLALPL
jgi:4-hydroxybenzoate polyprenyltransferase